MRWRESATRLVLLGVAACCVASLPLEAMVPDAAAEDELLIRILPDRSWELWHGPTRFTRERIARSETPLVRGDDDNAQQSRVPLGAALETFREERLRAGEAETRALRVESAPQVSFRLLLEVCVIARGFMPEGLTVSTNGREQGLALRLLYSTVRRDSQWLGALRPYGQLDIQFLADSRVELHRTTSSPHDDMFGPVEGRRANIGVWTRTRMHPRDDGGPTQSIAEAVARYRRTHAGEPKRIQVSAPRWDAAVRSDRAVSLLATLAPDAGIDVYGPWFPDDWLDEIGLSRR